MLKYLIFFSIYLATYAVNAEKSVLLNDAQPVMSSGLQNTQNTVGKNDVFGDLKMNKNLGNMQTAVRGMGTTVNRYPNPATGNSLPFLPIPQQNNKPSNSNNIIPQHRKRSRNNRNNNKRHSQSYGSPSSLPSPTSTDRNNNWANFQPVMASPQQLPPSPFSSEWKNYWDNFNPFMSPQIPYPPPTPQINGSNYNPNIPFNRFNNNKNENFGFSNGNNFNPFMSPQIPYPPPTPQINGSNYNPNIPFNNNDENIGYSNGGSNIVVTDDEVVINGKKYPVDSASTQGISVINHGADGYTINGKKVPADVEGNVNSSNKENSFNSANNIQNSKSKEGGQQNNESTSVDNLLSPNIIYSNDGLTFNGKKIPIDVVRKPLNDIDGSGKTSVGFSMNPNINYNNIDGLTIDGKRIPLDKLGNPLNAANIDGSGNISGSNVVTTDDEVVDNGKKYPVDSASTQGISVTNNGVDGYPINGKKVSADEEGNVNSSNKENSFNSANIIENAKSRNGGQRRKKQKPLQFKN
ncbi:uncharacterized protein DDB_G0283357-like isoform X3 [Adelges cooleyi]|uniref:uncharacterized protein DDB_G0283357-like isoform X3 n=1 Tax=Adelges cooleyi TaxID=133065 RepID=UPI0021802F1E|nr:uncharacterized protein DDB_G0283357-like isoform X3 [Adelges cooleyi]